MKHDEINIKSMRTNNTKSKHMKKGIRLILFLFLIGGAYSCEKVILEPEEFNETVSFQDDIIPIFNDKCVACHNGGRAPDLRPDQAFDALTSNGYVNTQDPEMSELYTILFESHSTRATPLEKQKILAWIKQGANND